MEKLSEDCDFPFYKMQTHLIGLPNILLLNVCENVFIAFLVAL